jgi:hypothetical protein
MARTVRGSVRGSAKVTFERRPAAERRTGCGAAPRSCSWFGPRG